MTTTLQTTPAVTDAVIDTLFREARTVVAFSDRPVDPAVVEDIFESFKFGPTMMNSLPLRLTFVQSPEARAALVGFMANGNRPKAAKAPLLAIASADRNFHETLSITFPHSPNAGQRFTDREQRGHLARMNATLQLGYFIIAARAHGLDVGPMTGYDGPAIAEHFLGDGDGDGDQDLLAVVALGYADESAMHPRNPRLPFEKVVEFI